MWTKLRQSHFLLIKIKAKGHFKLTLPVSLWTVDQLVESLTDLICFFEDILPRSAMLIPWKSWDKSNNSSQRIKISKILIMVREILNELRSYGNWRIVEIDTEDAKVDIQFL